MVKLVLLGGAGDDLIRGKNGSKAVFLSALSLGGSLLRRGCPATEVISQVIQVLESSGKYNAGKGGDKSIDGEVELDASMMSGDNQKFGAVICAKQFRHPILVAKLLLEHSPHPVVAESGLLKLISHDDIKLHLPQDEKKRKLLVKSLRSLSRIYNAKSYYTNNNTMETETVACVAMDKFGNLAAGCSTGGKRGKLSGRISPSASPGCELFASNQTCAVAFSGYGERAFQTIPAFAIHMRMLYLKESLNAAMKHTLSDFQRINTNRTRVAGFIGIDSRGQPEIMHTSNTMPWGIADASGKIQTGGWGTRYRSRFLGGRNKR